MQCVRNLSVAMIPAAMSAVVTTLFIAATPVMAAIPGMTTPLALDEKFLHTASYIELDSIRFYPALSANAGYDDNILESAGHRIDSVVTNVTPEFSALFPSSSGAWQLGAQANSIQYSDSSDDNFVDKFFFTRGLYEANSRNRFGFNGDICKCHEFRGTVLTEGFDLAAAGIDTPDEYTDKTLSANYEFGARTARGRLKFAADYLDHRYDNHRERTRYFDRDELGGSLTFLLRLSPGIAFATEGRQRRIEYAQQQFGVSERDSREKSLLVGLDWEATRATSGALRIGRQTKNFDADDRDDGSNVVWELSGTWEPRSYSTFFLDIKRSPTEPNGFGDFIDTKEYLIKWSHAWRKSLSTELTLSYLDQTYKNVDRNQQTDAAQFGIRYEMRRWLVWHLNTAWRDRDSNLDPLQFERQRYWLAVDISL